MLPSAATVAHRFGYGSIIHSTFIESVLRTSHSGGAPLTNIFLPLGECVVCLAGRRPAGLCPVCRGGGALRPARGPVPGHEAPVGRPRGPALLHPLPGVPAQRLGRLVSAAPLLDVSPGACVCGSTSVGGESVVRGHRNDMKWNPFRLRLQQLKYTQPLYWKDNTYY